MNGLEMNVKYCLYKFNEYGFASVNIERVTKIFSFGVFFPRNRSCLTKESNQSNDPICFKSTEKKR